jgi:pilus assembly protein TadC
MINIPFIEDFGKAFLPKSFRPKIRKYLESAGVYHSPYALIGYLFYISFAITLFSVFVFILPYIQFIVMDAGMLAGNFYVWLFTFLSVAILMFGLMFFFFLLGYFVLDMRVYKRVRDIEEHLPEFLIVVSTNLKGGMNIDAALWNGIKPKFGVLAEEITLVSKKVMTGYDVGEALEDLHNKYESPELKRTLSLIISELEMGGKISKIIDDIISQLKNTKKLKNKMVASVLSYVIFISAITMFIAPILFALSYNLVSFIYDFVVRISTSVTSGAGAPTFLANLDPTAIDPSTFKIFGYVANGTIALFSSMIVSIIQKGDVKGGLKYIPIFLFFAIVVYYISLRLLGMILGGIVL